MGSEELVRFLLYVRFAIEFVGDKAVGEDPLCHANPEIFFEPTDMIRSRFFGLPNLACPLLFEPEGSALCREVDRAEWHATAEGDFARRDYVYAVEEDYEGSVGQTGRHADRARNIQDIGALNVNKYLVHVAVKVWANDRTPHNVCACGIT